MKAYATNARLVSPRKLMAMGRKKASGPTAKAASKLKAWK